MAHRPPSGVMGRRPVTQQTAMTSTTTTAPPTGGAGGFSEEELLSSTAAAVAALQPAAAGPAAHPRMSLAARLGQSIKTGPERKYVRPWNEHVAKPVQRWASSGSKRVSSSPKRRPRQSKRQPQEPPSALASMISEMEFSVVEPPDARLSSEPQGYAIKYFGITGGEIGVLSKRVPLPTVDQVRSSRWTVPSTAGSGWPYRLESPRFETPYVEPDDSLMLSGVPDATGGVSPQPSIGSLGGPESPSSRDGWVVHAVPPRRPLHSSSRKTTSAHGSEYEQGLSTSPSRHNAIVVQPGSDAALPFAIHNGFAGAYRTASPLSTIQGSRAFSAGAGRSHHGLSQASLSQYSTADPHQSSGDLSPPHVPDRELYLRYLKLKSQLTMSPQSNNGSLRSLSGNGGSMVPPRSPTSPPSSRPRAVSHN